MREKGGEKEEEKEATKEERGKEGKDEEEKWKTEEAKTKLRTVRGGGGTTWSKKRGNKGQKGKMEG